MSAGKQGQACLELVSLMATRPLPFLRQYELDQVLGSPCRALTPYDLSAPCRDSPGERQAIGVLQMAVNPLTSIVVDVKSGIEHLASIFRKGSPRPKGGNGAIW